MADPVDKLIADLRARFVLNDGRIDAPWEMFEGYARPRIEKMITEEDIFRDLDKNAESGIVKT